MTAKTNREIALYMITELYFSGAVDYDCAALFTGVDAEQIAENIEKLAQLGRTERWKAAIKTWASMVRENGNDPKSLRWAFLQYLVFAAHAA